MDIPETRLMLEQVRTFDHRDITDRMINDWQHALLRLTVEAVFDAIHDHYERCDSAHTVALTAGEVVYHARLNRDRHDAEERRRRDLERNEQTFGQFHDHRTEDERRAALNAARAGRAHIDHIIKQRRQRQDANHG